MKNCPRITFFTRFEMSKANPGISKLLSSMKKLILEVNDQEICRRLDILLHSGKDDLPAPMIRRILENPTEFDAREVPEPYTQYVKHYLYMLKRDAREKEKDRIADSGPRGNSRSRPSKKNFSGAGITAKKAHR